MSIPHGTRSSLGRVGGSFVFGNGLVSIVAPNGETVWSYEPPNTRVFDAEVTNRSTILVSTVMELPVRKCPTRFKKGGGCAKNSVVELTPGNKSVVWQYSWYDQYRRHHGVHDADRLASGLTAIADMGNHRAFTVTKQGKVAVECQSIHRGRDRVSTQVNCPLVSSKPMIDTVERGAFSPHSVGASERSPTSER